MIQGEQHKVAARRLRWVKICVCLLVSLAMHVCLISVLAQLKFERLDTKPVALNSPVKIRIVTTAPKTAPIEAIADEIPKPHSKKTVTRSKRKLAKSAAAPSPVQPTWPKDSKPPAIERYDQLFPKAGVDFPVVSTDTGFTPDTAVRGLPGFDPENDHIPFATKTHHLSKLTVFAKDLAEHITVPSALRKMEPSGAARVRLSRKGGEWKVTEAAGDPYFRALLYETLGALSPETYGLVMLAATEFESVRVHFEFRTISVVDQTTKPIDVTIDGNKIFIVMTRQDADPKWSMLMASPAGLPTVNLLGIGWVLAKPYIEPDPNADIEVKRLRLSPAFIRPIGR